MTVASSTSRASYSGNGVTTAFTVPFRFLENTHLAVYLIDEDGLETLQTLTTHYTVSGAGASSGTVTMVTPPAVGEGVVILRDVPLTQAKDYVTGDKFSAESHEEALDKLTMITQQLQEEVDRSMKVSVADDEADFEALAAAVLVVAGIDDEIRDVAEIKEDVETVAANDENVSTVAGNISGVNTVAASIANVNAVAANEANVDTVAGSIANVNAVGGSIGEVNTLAGLSTEISALYAIRTAISTVAADIAAVVTTAANTINIAAVAAINSAVSTVAGIAANVTAVAGIASDVTTVADNIGTIGAKLNKDGSEAMTGPLTLPEMGSAPATPASGFGSLYFRDGELIRLNDTGDEQEVGAGGGGGSTLGYVIDATEFGTIVINDQGAATANLATIHAARDYIIANVGTGIVRLPRGRIYIDDSLVIRTGVGYQGSGMWATRIALADGSDCDVIKTISFDADSMERSNGASKTAVRNFCLRDLAAEGNRGNQTLGADNEGNGISIFGYGYQVQNVMITNCIANGFYSEWEGGDSYLFWGDNYSPEIDNVCITFCTGTGFVYRGPNDPQVERVTVCLCGVTGVSTEAGADIIAKGRGVSIETGTYPTHGTSYIGGGQFDKIHSFANAGMALYSNSWMKAGTIEAEASEGPLVVLEHNGATEQTTIEQLVCYKPNRMNTSGVVAVKINGARYQIGSLRLRLDAPDLAGSAPYESLVGLQLTGSAQRCRIDATIDGMSVNRTTVAADLVAGANGNTLDFNVFNCNKIDPTNQDVNGSMALRYGAVSGNKIDLNAENCAVIARRGTTTSTRNFIRISGYINFSPATGQHGLTGNFGTEATYTSDIILARYLDNTTDTTFKGASW